MRYRSALDCVRRLVTEEGGLRALYRGASISVLKTVPGAAIHFIAYDLVKTGLAMVDPTTGVTPPL